MQILRGPRVHVEAGAVGFLAAAENNADEIVWTQLVIAGLHRFRNLVIGLSDHVAQFDLVRVIAKRFKREDFCHRENGPMAFYQEQQKTSVWPASIQVSKC